jgi:ATP-dependent DNA helicase RecQ
MKASLDEWIKRGYSVTSASVRFIVAWKPKDAPKEEPETAVMLADLKLSLTEPNTEYPFALPILP